MTEYLVEWRIEVEAESTLDAARKALDIQRDTNSRALFFNVSCEDNGENEEIDLEGDDG